MGEKDVPGVLAHGGAFAGRDLERLQRGEAVQDLLHAEPGDEEESQEEHQAAGEDVLSAGATQQHHQQKNAELHTKA